MIGLGLKKTLYIKIVLNNISKAKKSEKGGRILLALTSYFERLLCLSACSVMRGQITTKSLEQRNAHVYSVADTFALECAQHMSRIHNPQNI